MIPPTSIRNKFNNQCRLTQSARIRFVLKNGKKIAHKWLCIHILDTSTTKIGQNIFQRESKIAVIVSKKALSNAIYRNTFKRVTREYYRLNKNRISSSLWIVIQAVKTPPKVEKKYFLAEIKNVFQKAQLT